MTYTERVAIDCIDTFENFLEDRGVRVPSSDEQMEAENCLTGNTARIYGDDFGELQETLADDIGRSMKRVNECVFDLTLTIAGHLRHMDVDSRAVFEQVHDWALEFEEHYTEDDDYMTEIDKFGYEKLIELMGGMQSTFYTHPDVYLDYERGIENENYDNEVRGFAVPTDWATDWVMRNCNMDLNAFYHEYVYDETLQMYAEAIAEGKLLKEWREERW